jgi:hypothetical protein
MSGKVKIIKAVRKRRFNTFSRGSMNRAGMQNLTADYRNELISEIYGAVLHFLTVRSFSYLWGLYGKIQRFC